MESKRRSFFRKITLDRQKRQNRTKCFYITPTKHKVVRRIDFEHDRNVSIRQRPLTRSQTKKAPPENSTVQLSKTKELSEPQSKIPNCNIKLGKSNNSNCTTTGSSLQLKTPDRIDDDSNHVKMRHTKIEERSNVPLINVLQVSQHLNEELELDINTKEPAFVLNGVDSFTTHKLTTTGITENKSSACITPSSPESSNYYDIVEHSIMVHRVDTDSDNMSQPEEDLILSNNDFDKNEDILKNIEFTDDIENALYEEISKKQEHSRFSDPEYYLTYENLTGEQNMGEKQVAGASKKRYSDSEFCLEHQNSSIIKRKSQLEVTPNERKFEWLFCNNENIPTTSQELSKTVNNGKMCETESLEVIEQQITNEDLCYVAPLRHSNTTDFEAVYLTESVSFEQPNINEDSYYMASVKSSCENWTEHSNTEYENTYKPKSSHSSPLRSIENVDSLKRLERDFPEDSGIPKKIPKKKDFFNSRQDFTDENRFPPSKRIQIIDTKVIQPSRSAKKNQQNIQKEPAEIQQAESPKDIVVHNVEPFSSNEPVGAPKKYKLNKHYHEKKFIDFLSDEEDFAWSSSSWAGSSHSETDTTDTDNKTSRTTRKKKKIKKTKMTNQNIQQNLDATEEPVDLRKKKKKQNKREEMKSKRNKGEAYNTKKGKYMPGKYVKINPCTQENCNKGCFNMTEEKRLSVFNYYWSLSSQRKSDWLVSNTKKNIVARRRSKNLSRRDYTYKYFINEGEGQREVCLKFLLQTLDIKQRYLNYTIRNAVCGLAKEDFRGHATPANKTSEELLADVKEYISNLPAVPSHYCRKNSTRCYLPREFINTSNLYRIYKQTKCADKKPYVGETVFRKVFTKEFNIGFHIPRKDKCAKCLKYENKTINEEEHAIHLKNKEETNERFKQHQNIHLKDKSILCTSFDLQKVLNTPYSPSLLLFYYRKLSVYNLTFYESGTRDGFCFTWPEMEGKRGANEVCTILQKYIQLVDNRGSIKHLLLYSDCCPGQNRNKIVLACLHKVLQSCENLATIQVNYLLSGHTYMPVDSMHSVIEKSTKNSSIWTPSQWPAVFSVARKQPKPYNVNVLTHKDFLAWDVALGKYFKNIAGKISQLRIVTIKKSMPEKILVKFSMGADAEEEEIAILKSKKVEPKRVYKTSLSVSSKKYQDIIKMCSLGIIPECYHDEFIKIQRSDNIKDTLEDTDVEDEMID